jgi:predicted CXXCH cytochrome family protein
VLSLCGDCHDDKDLKAMKGHAGAEGKICTACHDPHVGNNQFLLKPSATGKAVEKEAPAAK